LVNPKYPSIEGVHAIQRLAALPQTDLLIIASPPETVPDIVAQAGAIGCPAAVIITAGLGEGPSSLNEKAAIAARACGMRLLGPNCLGIQVPHVKLDASFAAHMSRPGDIAVISQSGAIVAGLVEWARRRSVGFSAVVSLGNQIDVDFGDLLDYFATDRATRSIVLYVEAIQSAQKFMSAARAAARSKPVLVIKSGRHAQGAVAAKTHTGALASSDAVYDAAFSRAGLVRVFDLDELFDAAETLSHVSPFQGDRLGILTNGGGIGVLAVDRLVDFGGKLATLSPDTIACLDREISPLWSHANPADIAGDADATRYATAMRAMLADPAIDALLVMNVPTALASAREAAEAVIECAKVHRQDHSPAKPIFAVWVGAESEAEAEFDAANIPHFGSETEAVHGFIHLVRYREGQEALMATPPSLPSDFTPDASRARAIVHRAVEDKRSWLDPLEIADVLAAYEIPIASVTLALSPDEAVTAARPLLLTGAVAVKILSPDIVHKSDIGGVRLNLRDEASVRDAAADILSRARKAKPDARITGVTVHPMIVRPQSRELIAGVADDKTFGPVIVFGAGGTAVEVINDKALALPPLDLSLADDLIGRTRISSMLRAYRDVPAADRTAIALVLVKLAQLVADVPEITEIDLNPLLADNTGVIVLDARVSVTAGPMLKSNAANLPSRLAIRPYPKEWERKATLNDGLNLIVRPVRPEDEPLYPPFLRKVTAEDLRLRFFAHVKEFGHAFISRFTQIDYARAMAFVAIDPQNGDILGVSRVHRLTYANSGEFAVLVRSDFKGRGLGWLLMQMLIEYAASEGIGELHGEVLTDNTTMLQMCAELGFETTGGSSEPGVRTVRLRVKPPA
jgi:acetyltransferase